jgi:hypothetical protein
MSVRRTALVVLAAVAALLLGMRALPRRARATPRLELVRERFSAAATARGIDAVGLDAKMLRWLARVPMGDTLWPHVFRVSVAPAGGAIADVSGLPPVLGEYSIEGDRLRFVPRFPFAAGVQYRAMLNLSDVASRAGSTANAGTISELRFGSPPSVRRRSTRVAGVYPNAAVVPANVLRWYVEFTAPVEGGGVLDHVRLLDEAGRVISGALLTPAEELWDPEHRRLTLLVDPGRLKRGLRSNAEMGPPLVSGHRYRVVIDSLWRDADGAPLAAGFAQTFVAGPVDRSSPRPAGWTVTPPPPGTNAALRVSFGESLDHASAHHALSVIDPKGSRVDGSFTLVAHDSVWTFSPAVPWQRGEYILRVAPTLEDVAGNSVARAFDVDRAQGAAPIESSTHAQPIERRFQVR